MNPFRPSLCLLLFFTASLHLLGQDPQFSQFFANRVYLNSAYAGFDPGQTVTINYRDQWFGVPDASQGPLTDGFRTFNVTTNLQVPCINGSDNVNAGLAASVFYDAAGAAPMVTQGAGLAGSLGVRLGGNSRGRGKNIGRFVKSSSLRAGFQLSVGQRRLESTELIYSYQLDPIEGLIGDYSGLALQSNLYTNLNAGLMYRSHIQIDKYRKLLLTVGGAVSNILEPNISLIDDVTPSPLPRRYTFHASATMNFGELKGSGEPWYISPQFRWDRQLGGQLNTQTVGFYGITRGLLSGIFVQYNFPGGPVTNTQQLGVYRATNTPTLILHTSVDLRHTFDWGKPRRKREQGIVLGLTYDIPMGSLNTGTTNGVIELNLRMHFQSRKSKRRSCGDLSPMELYRGGCPWRY